MIIKVWERAPEWARWLARDFNGQWNYFENRPLPTLNKRVWVKAGGRHKKAWLSPNHLEHWRTVLHQR